MNELILEIMKIALKKCHKDKNTVQTSYDTINETFDIYIFKDGYKGDFGKHDYHKFVALEFTAATEKLQEILDYLKGLEVKEMEKLKFIKKEDDLAEYEIAGEEKERVFKENGEEYKAEKIERRTSDEK